MYSAADTGSKQITGASSREETAEQDQEASPLLKQYRFVFPKVACILFQNGQCALLGETVDYLNDLIWNSREIAIFDL
jgi:hypothetical protein